MPQIIAHWSFKDAAENIDIARIFREAPPEARVLRIYVGAFVFFAMRRELYLRAHKSPVRRPVSPRSRRPWDPPLSRNSIFSYLSPSCRVLLPHPESWVFTILPVEFEAAGQSVRVFDLLDWLNRADAYYDSLVDVKVKVEAY